jgi:hypothetical protein
MEVFMDIIVLKASPRRQGAKRSLGVPNAMTKNQQNKRGWEAEERGRTGGGLGRPSTCLCSIPIGSRRYGLRKLLRHRTSRRGGSSQQLSPAVRTGRGRGREEWLRAAGAQMENERGRDWEESRAERGSGGRDWLLVDGEGWWNR